jgi:hypothetical protein
MATKVPTRTSIWSGQALAVGTPQNGAWQNLSTVFESQVNFKITNGATGPTVAAQVQIQVANDWNSGSPNLPINYGGPLVGDTANNGGGQWSIDIPIGVVALRLVGSGNTGQSVTLDADISAITIT